jgi:hypothetical protein
MTAPAPYLSRFEIWIGDAMMECWLDYEPPDRSTGQNAAAHLIHAFVGTSGMDVAELLSGHTVEHIENEAAANLGR